MAVGGTFFGVLLIVMAIAASALLLVFVLVPVFKALGWLIVNLFKSIGWLVAHVFEFIAGTIGDVLRFVGAIIALLALAPMAVLNVVVGRWSAAGHFADSVKRECKVAGACLYRVALRRPLKLLMLHGLLEGVEERVPAAMAAAPTSDKPSRRTGQFPGYTIVGSLKGGGSGAKLYIAQPDEPALARYASMPDRVVIKSFTLSEGSSLPQILRESRVLESAKQLGLVFEHGMDAHRFYYVMPYHAGDHLGIVTRQLHGQAGGDGLGRRQLATVLRFADDLVATLVTYHRGGLWHKDVKPENIIINEGRAHLVDLGLVTPLRSAMTLTTHGTEYFRDPELVRQALRGVKVHQINGAKFDIYAVGAVLYFMTENTFPPHGALSRFVRKSPDALRWIIRRAMADYSHRYEHADDLLADLRYVMAASDPFAVRPADLPSMSGRAVTSAPEPAVGTPVPPPIPAPQRRPDPAPLARPKLTVTNWWTGAYRVDDPGTASVVTPGDVRAASRNAATALRDDTAEIRHRVRAGSLTVRKAAREQIRAARARAKEIRRRARHTHRSVAERQPSGALAVIVLAAIATASFLGIRAIRNGSGPGNVQVVIHDEAASDEELNQRLVRALTNDVHHGKPVLLVPPIDPRYDDRLPGVVDEFRRQGFDVLVDEEVVLTARMLLDEWTADQNAETDLAIEECLASWGLYGFIDVQPHPNGISGGLVHSSRDEARSRRYLAARPPVEARRYLLINDHPVRNDPTVGDQVDRYLYQLRKRGWDVVEDVDLEAALRSVVPVLPTDERIGLPLRARALLDEAGVGGIVLVHADHGAGSPRDRVAITAVKAQPPVDVPAPSAPSPPSMEITVTPDPPGQVDSSATIYEAPTARVPIAA